MKSGRRVHTAVAAVAVVVCLSACAQPLPEADSEAAGLYQARCGRCHVAYQPGLLTAEMWRVTIDRMEERNMKRLGITLDPKDRAQILAYLGRHAGGK